MAKPKKRRKLIVFSIIGAVMAVLILGAIFGKHEVVIAVQTEKVSRRTLTEIVSYNGKIQPVTQVKISPEVSGEIIELPVREGQSVNKGDLVLKIKPDFYLAARNQSEAAYKSSLAAKTTAEASLRKAAAEFRRNQGLFNAKLISESAFDEVSAAFDIANAQVSNAVHQVEMARASLASAEEALAKTTIVSPLTGTISKLNSELGERVVGTATMAGTEVMTIADFNQMEARVDIGEMDVMLIAPGNHAWLEVDAFKDRRFEGTVTEIANSARGTGAQGMSSYSSASQEATKFEVRIRVKEKTSFRPGMSVTAEIETRSRTNALVVPVSAVTTRMPKPRETTNAASRAVSARAGATNLVLTQTNIARTPASDLAAGTNSASTNDTVTARNDRKSKTGPKMVEAVFIIEGDHARMVPVKLGILDDVYYEIMEGLSEGQEVVTGNYRAVGHDLEDGVKITKGGEPRVGK
jgi:HlyD family secretion protein